MSSAGLEALDNSSEDIVDATKEMNERIDGRFVEAPEDDDLHKRFKSLLEPRHFAYDMPGRVGAVGTRLAPVPEGSPVDMWAEGPAPAFEAPREIRAVRCGVDCSDPAPIYRLLAIDPTPWW